MGEIDNKKYIYNLILFQNRKNKTIDINMFSRDFEEQIF